MTDGRGAVSAALDALRKRLDPLIAARLADELGGLPWTAILEQLDALKGRTHLRHDALDLQSQLRLLTERLGNLGYPFDDRERSVSRLAGELRVVRNGWAHGREFDVMGTWRALDYGVRLLGTLGDVEGADALAHERDRWWGARDAESLALTTEAVPSRLDLTGEVDDLTHPARAEREPAAAVALQSSSTAQLTPDATAAVGDDPLLYEPWPVVEVGDSSVLDSLRSKASKEAVRAVIAEVVEFEGPISLHRLVRLVARSFGVTRLHRDRERQIEHQVKQSGVTVDSDRFVWPNALDPEVWSGYRATPAGSDRTLNDVSPREIANSAQQLPTSASTADVESAMLATFAVGRKGQQVAMKMEQAKKLLGHRSARSPQRFS